MLMTDVNDTTMKQNGKAGNLWDVYYDNDQMSWQQSPTFEILYLRFQQVENRIETKTN